MAQNKVNFGLKNLHYALITERTINGEQQIFYGKPTRLPGAVNMEMEVVGESSNFYADDIIYYSTTSNQGYEATLEIANLTEEFRRDVLGEVLIAGGILVENSSAQPRKVALLFEFDGDSRGVRHCLTYCTVTRPGLSGATKTETAEPGTQELTLTASPRPTDAIAKFSTSWMSEAAYKDFFNAVRAVEISNELPIGAVGAAGAETNSQTKLELTYTENLAANGSSLKNSDDVTPYITYSNAGKFTAVYTLATKKVLITLTEPATPGAYFIVEGLTGVNTGPINEVYVLGNNNQWTKH